MAKTLLVAGFGPGISTRVAERFGKEGFAVALVARNEERLTAGVKALEAQGVAAAGFVADLADATAVRAMVDRVRAKLGPIRVLHWNPYPRGAGDLLTADVASLHAVFDVAVTGLVTAVQACLPDLRKEKDAAVLVTNGGFGLLEPNVDVLAVASNAMGMALANGAKHKLVGLLAQQLKPDNVYVGELMVLGIVKGTVSDRGYATLDAAEIANRFWEMYAAREPVRAVFGFD